MNFTRTTLYALLYLAICVHIFVMVGHRQRRCGSPCTREFSDSSGLGRHRSACEHYKHRLNLQAQHFKRAGEDPKPGRAFKKMKPSLNGTSDAIQVSTSSIAHSYLA